MTRFHDWENRLEEFLADNCERAFAYGQWDCFQFIRGAVLAMTGENLAAGFRPYASRLRYLLQVRRYAQSTCLGTFCSKLLGSFGAVEIEPAFARRGDLVVTIQDACGLVALNGRELLMLTESGEIARVPLSQAAQAWRI